MGVQRVHHAAILLAYLSARAGHHHRLTAPTRSVLAEVPTAPTSRHAIRTSTSATDAERQCPAPPLPRHVSRRKPSTSPRRITPCPASRPCQPVMPNTTSTPADPPPTANSSGTSPTSYREAASMTPLLLGSRTSSCPAGHHPCCWSHVQQQRYFFDLGLLISTEQQVTISFTSVLQGP